MPTKKPIKSNVRTSARARSKAGKSKRLKITLAIVGLIVAAVGGFVIYESFASSNRKTLINVSSSRCSGLNGTWRANAVIVSPSTLGTCTYYVRSQASDNWLSGVLNTIGSGGNPFAPAPPPSGGGDDKGKDKDKDKGPTARQRCLQRDQKKYRWTGSQCVLRNSTNSGKNAKKIQAARPAPPPPPRCQWNNAILASNPSCQPPWPREFFVSNPDQWSPVSMYLAYPRKETTTKIAVDLAPGPNGMNNWNTGPKYDNPGNITGTVAFNDMKAQRYWYGNNTAGPVGPPRPYSNVLICVAGTGIGTIKIDVANTENKQETISSFNVNQERRVLCGTYPQNKITNFSVVAESRLGYPVKVNEVSMRLLP